MSRQSSSNIESRPTFTVEDYLMSMHVMERDHGEIIAARLAEKFGVAPATVAMTLKRMERDNWITGTGRKAVHLTETGREAAHSVTRRHMLTEWLLVSILKVPLPLIHDEAHGIEHAISPALEERMRIVLGDPKICPHGNPFPGQEAVTQTWKPLTELAQGEQITVRRIHENAEDDPVLLNFLIENGILPGTSSRVIESLPFNHTLSIQIGENTITLGFRVAAMIYAERLDGLPD